MANHADYDEAKHSTPSTTTTSATLSNDSLFNFESSEFDSDATQDGLQ